MHLGAQGNRRQSAKDLVQSRRPLANTRNNGFKQTLNMISLQGGGGMGEGACLQTRWVQVRTQSSKAALAKAPHLA